MNEQQPAVIIHWIRNKARQVRLKWSGRVTRRDEEYVGRRMLEMNVPGGRNSTGVSDKRKTYENV